jgi:enolase
LTGIIKNVHAREVFDEKGLPTVEVDVLLDDGSLGRAAAPGGTSRGASEAFDLRDGDRSYFDGRGVVKAIQNVNTEICNGLRGRNAFDQEEIDRLLIELDGAEDKSRLGGNAIVATSMANSKAAAKSKGIELFEHLGEGRELPIPLIHVMYGGPAYVDMAGTCDFQEYALFALSAKNYREGFLAVLRIYDRLREIVVRNRGFGMPRLAHLAGKITATFDSNDDALSTLTRLIEDEGYVPRKDFGIYLDIASSQLYKDGSYSLEADNAVLSRGEWIDELAEMCSKYPIMSMEDCLYEHDWEGWQILTKRLGEKVQLVGDDLFTTNPKRLRKGIDLGVANAIVIKPNQVGTLTETKETIKIAKEAGYSTLISGRSGQLWDSHLIHLCVGQSLGQGKLVRCPVGGPSLNEIIRVEGLLGEEAVYRDRSVFPSG